MKNRKKGPPEDKTPKFEFYLYNDAGRIIKQYLSIHEIQQILLQQSQNLGDKKYLTNQKKTTSTFFRAPAACLADWEKRDKLEANRAAEEDVANNNNNTKDSPNHGHEFHWQQLPGPDKYLGCNYINYLSLGSWSSW